ncbi:glycine zipper 2TM domain-containing protein [Novosphingobium bradum]|uniref:17 kDa surface antigen n=1 Tax=Novosphingobium bradum TaxID=1737444 RepID=A0ABV7IT35_9SPHN
MRQTVTITLAALGLLAASPALAHGGRPQMLPHWGGPFGAWYGGWQTPTVIETESAQPSAPAPRDRGEWLRECRHRLGDNGLGGAVIGGVVGGVAGHALAGHRDKFLGTVAGAAVGALAGAAIDRAEDAPRVRDRCEAMLDGWGQGAGTYPAGYGYGYGYGVPVMLVPVTMVAAGGPAVRGPCKETVVTEEIITTVPRHSRLIPRRAAPDKRVRLVPDKRVPQ